MRCLGIGILAVASAFFSKKKAYNEQGDDKDYISETLTQQAPSSPEAIRKQLAAKATIISKYIVYIYLIHSNPIELQDIMNPITAITKIETIDGLRLMLSLRPLQMHRFSGTWNYSNINSPCFSICYALFNPESEDQYKNYFTGEYSKKEGIHFLSSLSLKDYLLTKGELKIEDISKVKLANVSTFLKYKTEVRGIYENYHGSFIYKDFSIIGLQNLYRLSQNLSLGGLFEFNVSTKKPDVELGAAFEKDKNYLAGKYSSNDNHCINIGYGYHYNDKISFAVEHKQQLNDKASETLFVILSKIK